MNIYSVDKLKRDVNQDQLYNLFQTTIINNNFIRLYDHTVSREQEMRIDKVSEYIYESNQYEDELMLLNNIIDPWSIKEGDIIKFCKASDFNSLYAEDTNYDTDIDKLVDRTKSTKLDPSRRSSLNPTIKPKNMKQISVDKQEHIIKIINSFDD